MGVAEEGEEKKRWYSVPYACRRRAEYRCPKCDLRYCSLAVFQFHRSDGEGVSSTFELGDRAKEDLLCANRIAKLAQEKEKTEKEGESTSGKLRPRKRDRYLH